jgi:GNAT superfamily N-acetyltransferase
MDRQAWVVCELCTRLDLLPFVLTRVHKLEDLYVKPEHRAHGIGKAFFAELGKIAQEKVRPCAEL